MHWICNNKTNKTGFWALKLDMSKTYNRVEWNFMEQMMNKLGFAKDFVGLIIRCISSVAYSVRINHDIYGKIKPQRGLRQGDPLSSYLFAICAHSRRFYLKQSVINGFRELRLHLNALLFHIYSLQMTVLYFFVLRHLSAFILGNVCRSTKKRLANW